MSVTVNLEGLLALLHTFLVCHAIGQTVKVMQKGKEVNPLRKGTGLLPPDL